MPAIVGPTDVMTNAADRLLGLPLNHIQELAKDIIFGQLRLVVAAMDIEEINTDRDKFRASALTEANETDKKAEDVLASREKSTQNADIVIPAGNCENPC